MCERKQKKSIRPKYKNTDMGAVYVQFYLYFFVISHDDDSESAHDRLFDSYNTQICLYKPWGPKFFFKFEIIINILVSSFHFIWLLTCML